MSKTKKSTPSMEQWKRLYDVAERLKQLKPWTALSSNSMVVIELPDFEEPVFCAVMGSGGESYGVSVYPGYYSYGLVQRMISEGLSAPVPLNMMEQECLSLQFGDPDELERVDFEIMQQLGLPVQGQTKQTYFRSTRRGQFPWYINAEEAALLAETLEQLEQICGVYQANALEADFAAGEYLRRYYSEEDGEWRNTTVSKSLYPTMRPVYKLSFLEPSLETTLRKMRKTRSTVELDFGYLPIPVQENDKVPPIALHFTILMNRQDGELISQHLDHTSDTPEDVSIHLLSEYILAQGKPAAVYVRSKWTEAIIKAFCKRLQIPVYVGRGMKSSDDFLVTIMLTLIGH